jgi:hypothetical protein
LRLPAAAPRTRGEGLIRRRFYKVERWDAAELHVVELVHASNDLSRARAVFSAEKQRRPRGRYTLRQNIRVLERWPQH